MLYSHKRLLVWCMGEKGRELAEIMSLEPFSDYKIVGYTDSKCVEERHELFYGYPVYRVNEILSIDFDYIVIANEQESVVNEIKEYIKNNINSNLVVWDYRELLRRVRKQRILLKYQQTDNLEIKENLRWLKNHDLSVRNMWENKEKVRYDVFYDVEKGNYPYVIFKGKRMYYPKDYQFEEEGSKKFLMNIVECDQYSGSPHLYIYGAHKINEGDVVVDAGVAEGNFALSYIDIASKIYLVESDERWLDALRLTFAPYESKVVFVPKMLSDEDTFDSITLDTIIKEKSVDFIKMDIEGAEVRALLGGLNILKNNNVKMSVCSYHRKRDEEYIKFILTSLGYRVSHTSGYMLFLYDKTIDKSLDFRRGVIYAFK